MTRVSGEYIVPRINGGSRTNWIYQSSIDDLEDVTSPAPLDGQVLTWDGVLGVYVPRNPTGGGGGGTDSLYDLVEVSINPLTLVDGQVLTYDVTTNSWVAEVVPGGSLSSLVDVTDTSPLGGQVLMWDAGISSWRPASFNAVASVNGLTGDVVLTADQIQETATRQYYTNQRVDTRVGQLPLDALGDVNVGSPLANQVLSWSGTAWVARNVGSIFSLRLRDLSDVFAVNPAEGQTIVWSSASNRWQLGGIGNLNTTDDLPEGLNNLYFTESRVLSTLGTANLSTLYDVQYVGPLVVGQTLSWNGTAWTNGTGGLSTTDQLQEGSSNLYWTVGRFDTRLSQSNLDVLADVNVSGVTGGQVLSFHAPSGQWRPATVLTSSINTDSVAEGTTNLYFTEGRVDQRLGQVSINLLSDVDVSSTPPISGQALVYDGETNTWRPDDTTSVSVPLIYSTSGDTNGVFYYLGTRASSTSFQVPTSLAYPWLVTTTLSSNLTGEPAYNAIDRDESTFIHTAGAVDSLWRMDLGRNKLLRVDRYTLRARGDAPDNLPRNWRLEGSNNGTTWTTLHQQTGSGPAQSAWWVSPTLSAVESYRYLQIRQTGVNSSGDLFLTLAEVEFYGLLNISGVSSSLNTTDNLPEGNLNKYYTNWRVEQYLGQSSIDVLGDVNVSGRVQGSALVWDTDRWRPTPFSILALELDDLADVVIESPANNMVLAYDSSTLTWKAQSFVEAGLTSIDDLPDVDTSTAPPSVNDTLVWNGMIWVPGEAPQRVLSVNGQIGAVTLTTNLISEAGGKFYLTTSRFLSELGNASIQGLGDVSGGTPTTGQLLLYNGSNWVPGDVPPGSGGLMPVPLTSSGTGVVGNLYLVNTSGGAVVLTLPSAGNGGRVGAVLNGGSNTLTITTSELIEAAGVQDTELVLDVVGQSVELVYRSGVWYVEKAVVRG